MAFIIPLHNRCCGFTIGDTCEVVITDKRNYA